MQFPGIKWQARVADGKLQAWPLASTQSTHMGIQMTIVKLLG